MKKIKMRSQNPVEYFNATAEIAMSNRPPLTSFFGGSLSEKIPKGTVRIIEERGNIEMMIPIWDLLSPKVS